MNLTPFFVSMSVLLTPQTATKLDVELSFSKSVAAEPFSGRVFVIATKNESKGQPPGPGWFNPYPFFAQDVTQWSPDTPLKFQPRYGLWDKFGKDKVYLQ